MLKPVTQEVQTYKMSLSSTNFQTPKTKSQNQICQNTNFESQSTKVLVKPKLKTQTLSAKSQKVSQCPNFLLEVILD